MDFEFLLLIAGFGSIFYSYDYLERQSRKEGSIIKKEKGLPKFYAFFDYSLIISAFLMVAVYKNSSLVILGYLSVKMIFDGIYAIMTGKFPTITLRGSQHYFTEPYLLQESGGQVSTRKVGQFVASFFFIFFIAVLIFYLYNGLIVYP